MPSSTQVKEINERLTESYTKAGILQTQQVSIYLLYWYKSTNTDAAGGAGGSREGAGSGGR
jgi:hypothetical protein